MPVILLAETAAQGSNPEFSPDGRTVAFITIDEGTWTLHVVNRDGTGSRSLTDPGFGDVQFSGATPFSPDGALIAYVRREALWVAEVESGAEHRILGEGRPPQAWRRIDPGTDRV